VFLFRAGPGDPSTFTSLIAGTMQASAVTLGLYVGMGILPTIWPGVADYFCNLSYMGWIGRKIVVSG
jgi:hypothetical protein